MYNFGSFDAFIVKPTIMPDFARNLLHYVVGFRTSLLGFSGKFANTCVLKVTSSPSSHPVYPSLTCPRTNPDP